LPIIGIGAWSFGGGEYWGAQSQSDADAVVRGALDHGCNFFDTAEAYNQGASESSLGLALRGIPREKVLVCTKISPSNCEPKALVAHCEASLRRLQMDYLDIYMVHWPITAHSIRHFTSENIPTPSVPGAFAALKRLQETGKIRHIGVSNFGPAKLTEAMEQGVEIAINELPYSLLTRAIELEVLPFCRQHGIGVLGYMALLQGVLSGNFATLADIPELRRRTRHFDCRSTPKIRHGLPGAEAETSAALENIRGIAKQHGLPMAELSLKWAFAGPGITSSLCGARNLKQLQENLQAAAEPLDPGIIAQLNLATAPLLEKLGPSFDYWEHPSNDRTK
jgi:aryl-alcohol dehydrogenase-like predicted oxidoreductase